MRRRVQHNRKGILSKGGVFEGATNFLASEIGRKIGDKFGNTIGDLASKGIMIGSEQLDNYLTTTTFSSPSIQSIVNNLQKDNWGPYGTVGYNREKIYTEKLPLNSSLPPTEGSVIDYAPLKPESTPLKSITVKNPKLTKEYPIGGGVIPKPTVGKKLQVRKKVIKKTPSIITATKVPKKKVRRVYKKEI